MKRIIIGTAGHVDHGKTSLIKALTGVDCDRLKEEKERGLTIELGFTSLALPSGERVGVVDVPGHIKFIRHMLSGASGIDLVMLVVAVAVAAGVGVAVAVAVGVVVVVVVVVYPRILPGHELHPNLAIATARASWADEGSDL